jgi:hypothetical protein
MSSKKVAIPAKNRNPENIKPNENNGFPFSRERHESVFWGLLLEHLFWLPPKKVIYHYMDRSTRSLKDYGVIG